MDVMTQCTDRPQIIAQMEEDACDICGRVGAVITTGEGSPDVYGFLTSICLSCVVDAFDSFEKEKKNEQN